MVQIEDNLFEDIVRQLAACNKILAIKVVAACLKLNLKESKEFIDAL